jgi:hypothetical protein
MPEHFPPELSVAKTLSGVNAFEINDIQEKTGRGLRVTITM